MTTTTKIDSLKVAFDAGENWAKSLKVGDLFVGASPAATAAGYPTNTAEHRLFVHAALDALEGVTLCTAFDGNKITTLTGAREGAGKTSADLSKA